ncbi:complement C5 [Protopterus annectens]|uniref:complement C5 n=1 Tax=Protopterus annectens TaxID=7888 RepID=UPI001CFBBEE6|nr:complement C5 [Protopterus annectens]
MKFIQILCFLVLCGRTLCQEQTYLITAPKVIRVGTSEVVAVQTFGYSNDMNIQIAFKSYPDKAKTFSSGFVKLTAANKFQGSVRLTILPKDLPKKESSHPFVYLEAVSGSFTREEKLPVSYENGFLFIQTDKPIYTPDQYVKIRVYSMNQDLKPAKRTVILKFKDPEGVLVDSMEKEDFTGIVSFPNFQIPSSPRYGVWQIQAFYKEDFTTSATAEIEIKEYALPSFSVSIEPENNFIGYENFENFKITIKASYFHGRAVSGADVYARFGIINENNEKVPIPKSIKATEMTNGVAEIIFNSKTAVEGIGQRSLEDLDGSHLYISVAVVERPGGHTEESEHLEVKYVLSPYSINLVGTPLFVKPTLPYYIKAQVKDIMKQPVGGIPLVFSVTSLDDSNTETELINENEKEAKRTTSVLDGTALFVVNILQSTKTLQFKIHTAVEHLPEDNQAYKEYTAKSYFSLSSSYLYIDWAVQHKTLNVGEYINLNLYASSPYIENIKHFSYLVISKGRITHFNSVSRIPTSTFQSLNIPITSDMIPSARILAYYVVSGEGTTELVADSVWLSVKEKCLNRQELLLQKDYTIAHKPGEQIQLTIKAPPRSYVGLSATDIAIHKIRTRKEQFVETILPTIEKSDLGCGAGGGSNNIGVFSQAGLTFITNANAKAAEITDKKPCTEILRPKRASDFATEVERKLQEFKNADVRKCCYDGIREHPIIQTCFERASHITRGTRCYLAFVNCCQFANKLRTQDPSHQTLILARMEIQAIFGLHEQQIRSYFPESWLWEVHDITERMNSKKISITLPDSITTWEIQGVAISDDGICAADSLNVPVFKKVFLKVKMPYSVVRGEQVELQCSIHNYNYESLQACITMSVPEGVCLSQGSSSVIQGIQSTACTKKSIAASSVSGQPFIILPLKVGLHTVNFTLKSQYGNEIVVHTLRVVPEGVKKEDNVGFTLDPQGVYGVIKRRQDVRYEVPQNLVPKTDLERSVSVRAEILGEIISMVLSPEGVSLITNLPKGSAEIELMRIAPVIYIFHYLETIDNWNLLGPNTLTRRYEMRRKMKDGLVSLSSFRNKLGYSYSMWKDGEPSTWLTAFVLRIMGQVEKYIPQNEMAVCNSILWLIDYCQNSDGSFKERSHYRAVKLQGTGINEAKLKSLYLTAFTVIGLHRVFSICPTQGISDAINKAEDYLFRNQKDADSTFVLAITAYALSLSDSRSSSANMLFASLKREAFVKGEPPVYRFWNDKTLQHDTSQPSEATARMVETTAYALLTALKTGSKDYATPIVRWLSEQQRYGGGFFSTQDTVVALEALTEYSILLKRITPDMIIKVSYKKQGVLKQYDLSENKYFARPVEAPLKDDLVVSTGSGTGIATVNVKTVYHTIANSDEDCAFRLQIEVLPEQATNAGKRKRRQSSDEFLKYGESVTLKACAIYIPQPNEAQSESSHAVMDIGLVSGLEAEEEDLKTISTGVDQLVSDYQIVNNHVILQFDSIPSNQPLCIGFRIRQIFRVGMASPAVFTVYEYHTPDRRCSEFYNLYGKNTLIKLCNNQECNKCMEGECTKMKQVLDESLSAEDRQNAACHKSISYAYKVSILSSKEEGNFVKYEATILDLFKKGDDFVKVNTKIAFIKKKTCTDVFFNEGDHYLIMGKEGVRIIVDRSFRYEYPLDITNWVELWPHEGKCKTESCKNVLRTLDDFSLNFLLLGCN